MPNFSLLSTSTYLHRRNNMRLEDIFTGFSVRNTYDNNTHYVLPIPCWKKSSLLWSATCCQNMGQAGRLPSSVGKLLMIIAYQLMKIWTMKVCYRRKKKKIRRTGGTLSTMVTPNWNSRTKKRKMMRKVHDFLTALLLCYSLKKARLWCSKDNSETLSFPPALTCSTSSVCIFAAESWSA